MINNIEVLINSLLRDLLVQGPNAEVRIRKNTMVVHSESRQGRHNLNMYSNNLCITDDAFAMETIVYGHLRKRQRLAMLIFVLSEIHELLVSRSCCTYRELYYKCVYMDCSQRQIIKSVQDASQLLGQTSWNLGIFSSGKGMITGPLLIYMSSGDLIDCSCLTTATMIPPNFTCIDHFETQAQLVLIVEKDTIFKRLMFHNIFSILEGNVLLVTARGSPDLPTRWLLNKLMREHSHLTFYILTDGDPYGIEIMLTYRHGSLKYTKHHHQLACPRLKWLGIHPTDIVHNVRVPQESLTANDYKKIDSILRRNYVEEAIRRELILLKHHRYKAKLDNMSGQTFALFINDYIVNKIKRQVVL